MAKKLREDDVLIRTFRRLTYMYYHEKVKFFSLVGGVIIAIGALVYFLSKSPSVPGNVPYEFTEAMFIYASGDYKTAEERFKGLIGRYGSKGVIAKSYFYLGRIYYDRRDYNSAIRNFKKFISKYRKKSYLIPAAYMAIGASYENLNNLSEALKYYGKVKKYKKSPYYPYAMLKLGELQERMGKYDEALKTYKTLIDNKDHEGSWGWQWAIANRERLKAMLER